jgi:zinc protease
LVAVLADALRRPLFPKQQLAQVRRQRLVELQERDEDTGSVANLRFYETLFGRQHPYGRATSGYLATIKPLQRADLQTFHDTFYTPQQGVVVVTGAVETHAVLDLLADKLGDWRGPAADRTALAPPPVACRTPARIDAPLADKVQADIVLGGAGIARSHPDFYALRVANCILGQFGMMGRLGARVREQQGLAYYAYSSLVADAAGGVWTAAAGVNPANVAAAIDSIAAEFARIAADGVSAEELADSQAYLTGLLPLTLETNEGVASTLLSMEWYNLGLDFLLRYRDLIYNVTREDVQRVCAEYLHPDRLLTVVAGSMNIA